MRSGELVARHYRTGQATRLCWQEGRITRIEPNPQENSPALWLVPSLLDLQINGFAGVDFQQDQLTTQDLLQAARGLRTSGCAQFFLTLITDDWSRLIARLKHIHQLRRDCQELQNSIVGWHIEGPFLSAEPGFAGAHNPAFMCDPTPDHLRALGEITGQDPVLLTLAPERLDAIAAIPLAVSLGFRVSLGHTNATAKRLKQAVQAGATGFTHLANGCPRQLDRHDNIIWRVFDASGLTVSLIPDAIHVPSPLFRIIHRNINPELIYYTSDAMAAAGAPPGRYRLGALELEVAEDHIVRQPGSELFAGSGLQPLVGVFRASDMLSCPWQECWTRFSETPARFMGFPPALAPGQPATFCLLNVTPENRLENIQVWFHGEQIESDF